MFLLERLFVAKVVLSSLVNVKAQSRNVPYCDNGTNANGFYFTPALDCHNYNSLPTNLKNPTELREIRISSQKMEILKNGELNATNLVNLKALELYKAIKTIEFGAFRGANKIQHLSLDWNQIEEIDLSVFKDLLYLEELRLNNNPLQRFLGEAEFPKLDLTNLDLGNCRISSIPPNLFRNLKKLQSLNLHNNQLKVLDWKAILPLKRLYYLEIGKNPIHCDCKVKFLLDFLTMKNVKWHYHYHPYCQSSSTSSNEKLIGLEWDKIDQQLLVCPPEINFIRLSKPSNNQTLNGNEMRNVSIECKYEGYPEPNVTWTKDEMSLSFGSGVTIETRRDDDALLEFNYKFKQILTVPSSSSFNGIYKCQIADDLGYTFNAGLMLELAFTTTASTSTEFTSIWTTEGTTISSKNIYKSLKPAPFYNGDNISHTTPFHSLQETPLNGNKDNNISKEIAKIYASFQIIIFTLVALVILLLGIIISSGIYIAVRYTKMKRKALPKNIYKTVQSASMPNSVSQTMTNFEDPPYPPLIGGLENVYEICGDSDEHFYEIPAMPSSTFYLFDENQLG